VAVVLDDFGVSSSLMIVNCCWVRSFRFLSLIDFVALFTPFASCFETLFETFEIVFQNDEPLVEFSFCFFVSSISWIRLICFSYFCLSTHDLEALNLSVFPFSRACNCASVILCRSPFFNFARPFTELCVDDDGDGGFCGIGCDGVWGDVCRDFLDDDVFPFRDDEADVFVADVFSADVWIICSCIFLGVVWVIASFIPWADKYSADVLADEKSADVLADEKSADVWRVCRDGKRGRRKRGEE
jgi:hypothetical protein